MGMKSAAGLNVRAGAVAVCGLVTLTSCGSGPTEGGGPQDDLRQLFRIRWSPPSASDAGDGGHAFLLDRPGSQPLALTAYHVAGPVGAAPDPGVPTAWLRSPVNPSIVIRLGARLPIPGARTISSAGSQDDMAAFEVMDWDPSRALELAADLPSPGDTVWVLAVHTGDGPANGPRRHPARVAVAHDSALVYSYLASANTNGSSGAAVLDRDGRVVGVNVGTLIMTPESWQRFRDRYGPCCEAVAGNEVVGLAVGVRSIRRHLAVLGLPTPGGQ